MHEVVKSILLVCSTFRNTEVNLCVSVKKILNGTSYSSVVTGNLSIAFYHICCIKRLRSGQPSGVKFLGLYCLPESWRSQQYCVNCLVKSSLHTCLCWPSLYDEYEYVAVMTYIPYHLVFTHSPYCFALHACKCVCVHLARIHWVSPNSVCLFSLKLPMDEFHFFDITCMHRYKHALRVYAAHVNSSGVHPPLLWLKIRVR